MTVKPRERVETAINHRQPDRTPMLLSWVPELNNRLMPALGLELSDLLDAEGNYAYTAERMLGNDMLLTWTGWVGSGYYQPGYDQVSGYTDEWGVGWVSARYETPYGPGHYTELRGHPIADEKDLDGYKPPDPERPEIYAEATRVIERFKDEYWIVIAMAPTLFEVAWALHGLEATLADLVANPRLVERLMDMALDYHIVLAQNMIKLGADMIWIGDDIGQQHGMLMSPKTWRSLLKPRLARLISSMRKVKPDITVAYHTCGNVWPVIPELIEVGVDVLQPVQPRAMDPSELKRKFGDDLTFWGTVDEQGTLPFGTPEQVKAEVRERVDIVGENGGLIIGPSHHLQIDTPLGNLWAMIEEVTGKPPTSYEHVREVESAFTQ